MVYSFKKLSLVSFLLCAALLHEAAAHADTFVSGPSVATDPDAGVLYVFARESNNAIYMKNYATLLGFSAWSEIPGATDVNSDPDASIYAFPNQGFNSPVLVARRSNNAVWYNYDTSAGWHGWSSLGGTFIGGPTIAVQQTATNDWLHVFGVGTDHRIYWNFSSNGTTWSGWNVISNSPADFTGGVDASPALNTLGNLVSVCGERSDNRMYCSSWTGSAWTSWQVVGSPTTKTFSVSGPSMTPSLQWPQNVFARGTDNLLYVTSFLTSSSTWSSWSVLPSGSNFTSDPDVGVLFSDGFMSIDEMFVFAKGGDNRIWYSTHVPGSWSGWTAL